MELTIDKFGRVVIPKKLREHLGVGLSLKVEVQETAEVKETVEVLQTA